MIIDSMAVDLKKLSIKNQIKVLKDTHRENCVLVNSVQEFIEI